jgi:methylated-DNA-[protein]-cysteine S-methyltransferase
MKLFSNPYGPNIKAAFFTNHSAITSITLAEHNQEGCCWQLETDNPNLAALIHQWMNRYCEKAETPQLPLAWPLLTPFTLKALTALPTVGFGQVISYQQLASIIGHPNAYRAAGTACGQNPFPLVIPCHRILSKNNIGGFAFGLGVKKQLLSFENSLPSAI